MKSLNSILLALDRDDNAQAAAEKAVSLARAFGATLRLFLCDAECGYALKREYSERGVAAAREGSLAESRRFLEKLRRSVQVPDVDISIASACESPLDESVLREIERMKPDLVVRSIDGDRVSGVRVSGTELALLRNCPAPLLLARTRPWEAKARIAAAVDISHEEHPELTRSILQSAAFLATTTDGELEVVHGMEPGETITGAAQQGRRALAERVAESGVDARQLHVVAGEASFSIARLARQRRFDVLVLGSLTHRKGPAACVGSLAGKLLDTLDCDFLLVKPPAFVSPATLHAESAMHVGG